MLFVSNFRTQSRESIKLNWTAAVRESCSVSEVPSFCVNQVSNSCATILETSSSKEVLNVIGYLLPKRLLSVGMHDKLTDVYGGDVMTVKYVTKMVHLSLENWRATVRDITAALKMPITCDGRWEKWISVLGDCDFVENTTLNDWVAFNVVVTSRSILWLRELYLLSIFRDCRQNNLPSFQWRSDVRDSVRTTANCSSVTKRRDPTQACFPIF